MQKPSLLVVKISYHFKDRVQKNLFFNIVIYPLGYGWNYEEK